MMQPPVQSPVGERIVDLTYPFDDKTIYWPTCGTCPFHLEPCFEGVTERGFFYSAKRFAAYEHGGTHMDAPYHFDIRTCWKMLENPKQ
jgi:kynurenine formamidase